MTGDRAERARGGSDGDRAGGLHLGVDFMPAVQHAPGVGRYVRELVRALVRRPDAPRLALFEGGLGPRPMEGAPLGFDTLTAAQRAQVARRRVRLPRRGLALLARLGLGAERLVAGSRGSIDLFHRVHARHPPLSGGRHTLALAELPSPGTAADSALGAAARTAAGLIVFDAHFAAQVAARYGLEAARVHVVPVGCDHWERDLAGRAAPRRAPRELVVLGAIRRARHPLRVLAAFEGLVRGGLDARLRFVGRPGDEAAPFEVALGRSPARDRVQWVRAPREAEMPALVAGATALVHLADEEGSAVTPLEACRFGLAIVASDLPAFRAALGSAAHWAPTPEDVHGLTQALAAALEAGADEGGRAMRRRIAAPYTWDASAEAHLVAFRTILMHARDARRAQ
ncbi:MAG: glycosyltransferase [Planctomycetota bacterium]